MKNIRSGPAHAEKTLFVSVPSMQQWFISAPTYIGINSFPGCKEYAFVLFGFGLIWNSNWDIDKSREEG